MKAIYWAIISGLLMSCIALAGSLLLFLKPSVLDSIILPLVSFSAGSLIGGAVFHMLPHAVEKMGNVTAVYVWLIAGFALFLGLEQFLNWHHSHTHSHTCGPFSPAHQHGAGACQSRPMTNSLQEVSRTHVSGLDCGTIENDNRIEQTLAEEGRSNAMSMVASSVTICYGSSLASHNGNKVDDQHTTVSTVRQNYDHAAGTLVSVENCSVHSIGPARADKPTSQQKQSLGHLILIADAVHNFLGGLFVGASFVDSTKLGMSAWTAAAVHEVPQELGDFAILIHAGWSKSGALAFNFLSALTFPLGAIIACVSSKKIDVSFLIPFAAGNFLYIGATDLIPEVKHCHGMKSNAVNYAAFLLGVGLLLTVRIAVDGW